VSRSEVVAAVKLQIVVVWAVTLRILEECVSLTYTKQIFGQLMRNSAIGLRHVITLVLLTGYAKYRSV
jgi:hypothetical protein